MRKIIILFAVLSLVACKKSKRIDRNLSGDKWNIVSYTRTFYANSNVTNVQSGSNVGYVEFSKGSLADMSIDALLTESNPGLSPVHLVFNFNSIKYEVTSVNDKKYDARVEFDDYPRSFYYYYINKSSRSKMKFKDDSNFQYLTGDGSIVELLLEKE